MISTSPPSSDGITTAVDGFSEWLELARTILTVTKALLSTVLIWRAFARIVAGPAIVRPAVGTGGGVGDPFEPAAPLR